MLSDHAGFDIDLVGHLHATDAMPPAADGCDAARRRPSVKTRTLANLSRWPEARFEALARVLIDEPVAAPGPLESGDRLEIERSWQVDVAEHRFGTVLALPRHPGRVIMRNRSAGTEGCEAPRALLTSAGALGYRRDPSRAGRPRCGPF